LKFQLSKIKLKVKIDAGTQPGKILRLRGKGLPDINGYGRGDLLAKINVWVPSNVSKDEKKILEKLQASDSFTPKPTAHEKSFFKKVKTFSNSINEIFLFKSSEQSEDFFCSIFYI